LNAVVFIDLNRVSLTLVSVWRCTDTSWEMAYLEMLGVVVSCIAANALSAWFREQLAPVHCNGSQDQGSIGQQNV
jgi:hypothetical protein